MSNISKEYIERDGLTLKVTVAYNLGGMNYFSGGVEARGYYLGVTPVQVSKSKSIDGREYTVETTVAFSGYRQCVHPVTRQSKKGEAEALKLAEQHKEDLIDAVIRKNPTPLILQEIAEDIQRETSPEPVTVKGHCIYFVDNGILKYINNETCQLTGDNSIWITIIKGIVEEHGLKVVEL